MSQETEIGILREKYIKLLENREADASKLLHERKTLIEEKEYTTSLRIAIANIPLDNKKTSNQQAIQAIRKAKRLAAVTSTNKRKYPTKDESKPKRKYVRRKIMDTEKNVKSSSKRQDASESVNDTYEEDDSLSSDIEDSFISGTESDMDDTTRQTLQKVIGKMRSSSPSSIEKPQLVVTDHF